jgi:hypothetical protein
VHDLLVCNVLSSLIEVIAFHLHLLLLAQLTSGLSGFQLGDFDLALPVLLDFSEVFNCVLLHDEGDGFRLFLELLFHGF